MTFLLKLNQLLILNKNLILNLFRAFELSLLILLVGLGWAFFQDLVKIGVLSELGEKLGQLSLLLYLSTLIPGIVQRFRVLPIIGAMISPFKRHLGITMFIAAYLHQNFSSTLPLVKAGTFDPASLDTFQVVGSMAWWVLLPLWLTSNDTSQKFLGKYWKMLHRLTYVALFLIYLHVALMMSEWALLTLGFLVAEVVSWGVYWWRARAGASSDSSVL